MADMETTVSQSTRARDARPTAERRRAESLASRIARPTSLVTAAGSGQIRLRRPGRHAVDRRCDARRRRRVRLPPRPRRRPVLVGRAFSRRRAEPIEYDVRAVAGPRRLPPHGRRHARRRWKSASDADARRRTAAHHDHQRQAAGRGASSSRRIWSGCCKTRQPTRPIRRSRRLFVETEIVPERRLIVARRRPREPRRRCLVGGHWIVWRSIGRRAGRRRVRNESHGVRRSRAVSFAHPAALDGDRRLSGDRGAGARSDCQPATGFLFGGE